MIFFGEKGGFIKFWEGADITLLWWYSEVENSNIFRKYFPILSDMAFLHSWAQLLGIVEFSNFSLYQQCIFKIVQKMRDILSEEKINVHKK